MPNISRQSFIGLVALFAVMAALVFAPARTLDYWQAWLFLAAFFAPTIAITTYLVKNDPKLLERRVRGGPLAETQIAQKVIQTLTACGFFAMLLLPGLDHRFGWSKVPVWATVCGDALVLFGFYIIFRVYKENSFASATVEVSPEQRVVSTGLYGLVRHPMYMGAVLLFLGIPFALGSWVGLAPLLLLFPAVIWRLIDEERILTEGLPGYSEYRKKVVYRLVPFLW